MPREARIAARDEAAMPFPSEETTPPVTNTNLVMGDKFRKFQVYTNPPSHTNRGRGRMNSALRTQAARDAFDGAFASDQSQYGIDRRRARAAGNQHAQRHHHLRRLELVATDRVLDRSRDALALPRQRREFALQFFECATI